MTAPLIGEPDEIDLEAEREKVRDLRDAELKDQREMAEGEHARRLLEDPALVRAFERLETQWNNAWRNSPLDKPEVREESYRLLNVLGLLKRELQREMESGMIARKRKVDRDTEAAVEQMEGESERTF